MTGRSVVLGGLVGLIVGGLLALLYGGGSRPLQTNDPLQTGDPVPGIAPPRAPAPASTPPAAPAASAQAPTQPEPSPASGPNPFPAEPPVVEAPEPPTLDPVDKRPQAAGVAEPTPPDRAVVREGQPAEKPGSAIDLEKPRRVLRVAAAHVRKGRPEQAERLLRALLVRWPRDHHVMEGLVRALLAQGRGAEGVGLAKAMVRKRSRRASYRVLLGRVLLAAGDDPSAERAFHRALELDPDNFSARRHLLR